MIGVTHQIWCSIIHHTKFHGEILHQIGVWCTIGDATKFGGNKIYFKFGVKVAPNLM